MPNITLDTTYQGPFEVIGQTTQGHPVFESAQSAATSVSTVNFLTDVGITPPLQPPATEFEANMVNWSVAPDGTLVGRARFLAINTHDIVNATLSGQALQPPGKNYHEARVKVTFTGGTGPYKNATGSADVTAKLFADGLSVGHIKGNIVI